MIENIIYIEKNLFNSPTGQNYYVLDFLSKIVWFFFGGGGAGGGANNMFVEAPGPPGKFCPFRGLEKSLQTSICS
jgi:hypothetical protein